MFIRRIITYLNPATIFKKSEHNFNTRMMHGINRISIFMFLICLIVMLVKFIG